jgi:ribosomal protein L37AE/L43A
MREAIFRIRCDKCHTELDLEGNKPQVTIVKFDKEQVEADLCTNCYKEVVEFLSFLPFGTKHCPECGRAFTTAQGVAMHRYRTHDVTTDPSKKVKRGTYTCELCDKQFSTPQGLGTHRWGAHRIRGEAKK